MNLTFINDFEYYLRTERKCRTNTVWGYMIVLKHIISIARNSGVLPFNPFAGYINSPENVDRGYLSKEELQTLMNAPMKNQTYELVRDLFLFSVFTGLAYSDVKNLTHDNLQMFFDGDLWIITRRQKTNTDSNTACWMFPNASLRSTGDWQRITGFSRCRATAVATTS